MLLYFWPGQTEKTPKEACGVGRRAMANNQQDITDLFRIAVRGDVLIIPRDFIAMTGDLKSALFLARCVALAQRSPDATFARSSKEWQEDLFFSRHEVDAAREKVSRWVKTTLRKGSSGGPTMHYTVDFEQINQDLGGTHENQ
ncbi:MAG: hypothetical protein ACPLRM_04740 [Anaerolineae bacterium]|jgi:hypothetical protein